MKYIACFGDSLVQGFPFGSGSSWTAHAETIGSVKLLNYGVCGDCCDDIFCRMQQTVLPGYVGHIVFLGGANDILQGRPLAVIMEDIEKTVRWCAQKDRVLCIILPFISGDEGLNAGLCRLRRSLLDKYGQQVLLLDAQPAIGTTPAELDAAYLDGVHPKAGVYEAVGNYLRPLLEKWVQE